MNDILVALDNYGITPVSIEDGVAKFESGYETYDFYNAILSCVKEKLYIYGRKNRKLFTKNNAKIKELLDNNIDFKCLFLSDKSNSSILKMAQENDNFESDLNSIISSVKEKYADYINCFRKYDFQQLKRIIIIDDIAIYAPVTFENGNVKHFTKGEFIICDDGTYDAITLLNEFKKIWDISKSI